MNKKDLINLINNIIIEKGCNIYSPELTKCTECGNDNITDQLTFLQCDKCGKKYDKIVIGFDKKGIKKLKKK